MGDNYINKQNGNLELNIPDFPISGDPQVSQDIGAILGGINQKKLEEGIQEFLNGIIEGIEEQTGVRLSDSQKEKEYIKSTQKIAINTWIEKEVELREHRSKLMLVFLDAGYVSVIYGEMLKKGPIKLTASEIEKYISTSLQRDYLYSRFKKKDWLDIYKAQEKRADELLYYQSNAKYKQIFDFFLELHKHAGFLPDPLRNQLQDIMTMEDKDPKLMSMMFHFLFGIYNTDELSDYIDKKNIGCLIEFFLTLEFIRVIILKFDIGCIFFFENERNKCKDVRELYEKSDIYVQKQDIEYMTHLWIYALNCITESQLKQLIFQASHLFTNAEKKSKTYFCNFYEIEISRTAFNKLIRSKFYIEIRSVEDLNKRKILGKICFGNSDIFLVGGDIVKPILFQYLFNIIGEEKGKDKNIESFFQVSQTWVGWSEEDFLFVFQHDLEIKDFSHNISIMRDIQRWLKEGKINLDSLSCVTFAHISILKAQEKDEIKAIKTETSTGIANIIGETNTSEIILSCSESEKEILQTCLGEELLLKLTPKLNQIYHLIGEKGFENFSLCLCSNIEEGHEFSSNKINSIFRILEFFGKFNIYVLEFETLLSIDLDPKYIDYLFTYVWKRGGIESINDGKIFQEMIFRYLVTGNTSEIQKFLQKIAFFKIIPSHELDKYILRVLRGKKIIIMDKLAEKIDTSMRSLMHQMNPASTTSSETKSSFGTGSGRFSKQFQKHIFPTWLRQENESSEEYLFRIGSMNLGNIFKDTQLKNGDIRKLCCSLPNETRSFSEILLGFSGVILMCEKLSRSAVDLRPLNNHYMNIVQQIFNDICQSNSNKK